MDLEPRQKHEPHDATTSVRLLDRLEIRSDDLARLREVFASFPALAGQTESPQSVRLVIDANIVIADIRWLTSKRRTPSARTALQEAIASGTVVAFAPRFLDTEVRLNLRLIAERELLPLDPLLDAWTDYGRSIHLYEAAPIVQANDRVVDPKDVPYVETYSAIGAAAILTNDPHLERMGANTIQFEVTAHLRSYARAASIEFTLKSHGRVVLILTGTVLAGMFRAMAKVFRAYLRLPLAAQLLIGALILFIVLHRPTRERIAITARSLGSAALDFAELVMPIVRELQTEAERAHAHALDAWQLVKPGVSGRRPSLRQAILAELVQAKAPLSTPQLTERLSARGTRTTAKTFPRYLRRVLRSHTQVTEARPGLWSLKPVLT